MLQKVSSLVCGLLMVLSLSCSVEASGSAISPEEMLVEDSYWSTEDPGTMVFQIPEVMRNYDLSVQVMKGGNQFSLMSWLIDPYDMEHSNIVEIDFSDTISDYGSGEYWVEIEYYETMDGAPIIIDLSNKKYNYIAPQSRVQAIDPTTIVMEANGRISWEVIQGSEGYYIEFYKVGILDEYEGISWDHEQCNDIPMNVYYDWLQPGIEYSFTIQTRSKNIEQNQYSEVVESGITFTIEDIILSIGNQVVQIGNKALDSAQPDAIPNAVAEIKAMITDSTQLSMLASEMYQDPEVWYMLDLLEERYSNIKETISIAPEFTMEAKDVVVVGGNLNASASSTVEFTMGKAGEDSVILLDENLYSNSVQMSMGLLVDNVAKNILELPIGITMPMPAGMDSSKLVLLHYYENGSHEEIEYIIDENGKMSFVMTHLDEMVFAQKAEVPVVGFDDVIPGGWEYEPIVYAYNNNLMSGTGTDASGNVIFNPNGVLTREQFAQILYNAEGKPAITFTNRFTDVPDGQWYSSAIIWAAENNIVSGYNNGKYGVGDVITREQLAVMLYKYAQLKGKSTAGVPTTALDGFGDKAQVSDWANTQIQWAVHNKVMSGTGVNLEPKGQATRAACAAMLRNYFEGVGK